MKNLLPIVLGTTIAVTSCNLIYNPVPENGLITKLYSNIAEKIAQLERECTSIILSRYRY